MNEILSQPWNPERRWADRVILTLILLILVLVSGQSRLRRQRGPAPETQVSLQGRLQDLALAAPRALPALTGKPRPGKSVAATAADTRPGWDQAVLAVHAGEAGELDLGLKLAGSADGATGARFLQLWRHSYLGDPLTGGSELGPVRQALGDGYAARILEARLQARAGGDPRVLEEAARNWVLPRALLLGLVTAAGILLGLAGLGFAGYLLFGPGRPASQPLPQYGMSGRAALIVLLGWFLTLLAASPAISLVLSLFPFLTPVGIPLVYAFHAGLGTAYLCWAEGVPLRLLWARLNPLGLGRCLGWGLGFFALAFAAVMLVSLLLAPLMRQAESPQKELLDLLTHLKGPLPLLLVFLTVAVLAPAFEELLFRGFLLPWLGVRLESRLGPRAGWILALLATSLVFGAMHMQPWGLPMLSTLGLVLGLTFVRSGSLGSAILVHGLWNGSVFLAMRLVAG